MRRGHLEQEDPGTVDPPAHWPTFSGDIVFEDATIRYAPNLDPALQNLLDVHAAVEVV